MGESEEIPLRGGWVHDGVVRVGDTVRRPVSARSSFVHRCLEYLETARFEGAPRFLGIDERGREVLSFLPGETLMTVGELSDHRLRSGAVLLRRLHDAGAVAPRELRGSSATILHGDAGPWNMVWSGDDAIALIDFDEMRPGEGIEDLGYYAWKALRLKPTRLSAAQQGRRLHIVAEAYGVHVDASLLDAVDAAYARMVAQGIREGWPPHSVTQVGAEQAWFRGVRRQLVRA